MKQCCYVNCTAPDCLCPDTDETSAPKSAQPFDSARQITLDGFARQLNDAGAALDSILLMESNGLSVHQVEFIARRVRSALKSIADTGRYVSVLDSKY